MDLLRELCETPGVSGREERLRAIVRRELEPLVNEVHVDALGNLVGLRRGRTDRRLMIASHMDEIGFLVSHVDERGFLKLAPIGGHDPRNMVSQRVLVCGKEDLPGVLYPSAKPPHLQEADERDKAPKLGAFFVDLGLPVGRVREQVPIGSMVTLHREFVPVGETVCCKAMDNRLALYIMIEAMRRTKAAGFEVCAVATTQEEVGLRGAQVVSYDLEPDVAIALDVTIAADLPEMPACEHVTRLGGGTAIKIMDSASISSPPLVAFLQELAERYHIPYQLEILPRGGTDAGAMQRARAGAPAVTISTPTRYVHSSIEMVHRDDIEASIRLLTAFIEEGDAGDFRLT